MGSSPVDSATQKASSNAAQGVSATQAANAGAQTTASNQAYAQLLNNTSAAANPNSLNSTGLNSAYGNAYKTAANATANNAQQAVATSQQAMANRGGGATPNGFTADQERQALQAQAATNASTYSQLALQQQQDAINQYQYANSALANYGANQLGAATSNNSGAAGTNTSLYGTASQQKQSPLGTIVGGITGLASAGATAFAGR